MVYIHLIGTYSKSIRQQQLGGTILQKYISLTCMMVIDPITVWFEIFKFPFFELNYITARNYEYIDKSSDGVSHLFNDTWLCRYMCP